MKTKFRFIKRVAMGVIAAVFGALSIGAASAWAEDNTSYSPTAFSGFTMSPMNQRLILDPGESFTGTFNILNPATNTVPVKYDLSVRSFYRDEDNNAIFEDVDGMGQMAGWITLNTPESGTLAPGVVKEISYTINVPTNAPAGGQYASITATSSTDGESSGNAAVLQESVAMAYTIFAEIAGNTVHSGEIVEKDVPGFLFDGNISASSKIKNTGNVHGTAKYTLQVFPLFSNEEIYTNEENPEKKTILPNRTLYHETTWNETPAVGIFNVIYSVEFEGVTQQVKKMVIKCPIWLLFIILFAVIALVLWLVLKFKGRKAE